MAAITFSDYSSGLDLRKGASVSDANRLRVLDNCYVTTGKTIRKRPGLTLVTTLETGTQGLRAAGGKLNTFYATGTVTHADTRFVANKIAHPTLPAMEVKKIHYADVFNGYIYVSAEYNNGDIKHHYIDDVSSVTSWAASTTLTADSEVRPIVSNSLRYEVTTTGLSGITEPTWPTTVGDTYTEPEANYTAWSTGKKTTGLAYKPSVSTGFVYKLTNDGVAGVTEPIWPTTLGGTLIENGSSEIVWDNDVVLSLGELRRPTTANTYVYEVTTAGTTGATEPTWPVTPGSTVVNGTVTFTCRGHAVWTAATVLALGDIRKPTASNNYWYEVTTAGATGNTQPTWTTTVGSTVTEKDSTATAWAATTVLTAGAIRRPTVANGYLYEVTTGGTTAGTQPSWPTTVGATVVNGTVTFTCRAKAVYTCRAKAEYVCVARPSYMCRSATAIYDENCPNTAAVVKKSSKMYATDGDVVRFCRTSNPRDWTEPSDAGFLGVGIQQSGSANPTALGEYSGNLVVFFNDSAQVWTVDPDPSKMSFIQGMDVGCPYPNGAANMAGDVFFASYDGIRSITTQSTTGNLIDVDVGSPIDSLVKPEFTSSASIKAFYFRGGGQYWAMKESTAYVYSFSRTSKISAWSRYTFPFAISDVTELDGDLYFRAGNSVYKLDESTYTDAGDDFSVTIEFPYLDFKTPGVMKLVQGMDTVMLGSAEMQIKFDARQPDFITPPIQMSGDTRPGEMTAVEVCSVGIAPVITSTNSDNFELHAITMYYQDLGNIS